MPVAPMHLGLLLLAGAGPPHAPHLGEQLEQLLLSDLAVQIANIQAAVDGGRRGGHGRLGGGCGSSDSGHGSSNRFNGG